MAVRRGVSWGRTRWASTAGRGHRVAERLPVVTLNVCLSVPMRHGRRDKLGVVRATHSVAHRLGPSFAPTSRMMLQTNAVPTLAFSLSNACLRLVIVSGAFTIGGCGGQEADAPLTRDELCARWAEAACQPEVVSACQASSVQGCQGAQTESCLDWLPETIQDRAVSECLGAVADAFKDADLDAEELNIVLRLSAPCNQIVPASEGGQSCESDSDCDAGQGLSCVFKAESTGSCEVPELVSAGFSCDDAQQECEAGFYCDGKNCIAAKQDGENCNNNAQCGSSSYCDSGTCASRRDVGSACGGNQECQSGICYAFEESRSCVNRIRLSPSEPICDGLK